METEYTITPDIVFEKQEPETQAGILEFCEIHQPEAENETAGIYSRVKAYTWQHSPGVKIVKSPVYRTGLETRTNSAVIDVKHEIIFE